MRVLKIDKNPGFKSNMQPLCKPVFPFVGNKSNRREMIIDLIVQISNKLLPQLPTAIYDVFGGSFYLSHLIQIAAARMKHDITAFTNDYDNYSNLFSAKTMEHLLWYKSVCDDRPDLKRNELLSDEDCQRIDDYTQRNCPELDPWVIRFLTNYGSSRHYRKRLTDHQEFWHHEGLRNYVPNTVMTLDKTDWKDWIKWIEASGRCPKDVPTLWFVDPPYTTYGTGLYYGDGYDNLDIGVTGIVTKVLKHFPKALVVTFGYVRNFIDEIGERFPENLHYDELNEYWPACQGLRVRSRPEYTHIWYVSKENRALYLDLDIPQVIDKRNHGHVRADGKVPNMNAWTYDEKFGCL